MNKDLYIEFLESEIRRIRAGANTHYGQSIGWLDEMEDLKLENDRLKQRDSTMSHFIKSMCCSGETCSRDCDLYFEWNDHDCCALLHPKELSVFACKILKELEDL